MKLAREIIELLVGLIAFLIIMSVPIAIAASFIIVPIVVGVNFGLAYAIISFFSLVFVLSLTIAIGLHS